MNKKGFTLIELLTVIVLLSLIAVITTPIIIGVLNDSKEDLRVRQIAIIENSAEKWGVHNMKRLSSYKNSSCYLEIADLQDYLSSSSVKDTVSGEDMQGYIRVTGTSSSGNIQYKYEYSEVESSRPASHCAS